MKKDPMQSIREQLRSHNASKALCEFTEKQVDLAKTILDFCKVKTEGDLILTIAALSSATQILCNMTVDDEDDEFSKYPHYHA